jgi:alanine racemase
MAIVKANAYGHGAVEVSRAAVKGGASWLGVARFGEARILRENGIHAPILVMGMVTPDEVDEAIAKDVTLTLHSTEALQLYSARAHALNKSVNVHLKVDTGMGRLGVRAEDAVQLAQQARAASGIHIDGLYSHFALAEEEHPLNDIQSQRFEIAVHAMEAAGLRPRWVHFANSAAAFYRPQSRYDMVRVGNVILGIRIRVDRPLPDVYQPALTWKAQLASSRLLPAGWSVGYGADYITPHEEIIGVVPAGFGDGLRRVPGNQVLIGGEKHLVVGRLCLDQIMVRLPRMYPMGEEVVIIGQQGNSSQWVHDLAALYKISQIDFTALIHSRVPRIYVS